MEGVLSLFSIHTALFVFRVSHTQTSGILSVNYFRSLLFLKMLSSGIVV